MMSLITRGIYYAAMGEHRIPRAGRFAKHTAVIAVLSLAVGLGLGWFLTGRFAPPTGIISDKGVRLNGQYKLISPLLLCASTESANLAGYAGLAAKIQDAIAEAKKSGSISDVSLYFRDLAGHWIGINDTVNYAPASLLKVPIMIAYFKAAESDPSILSKKIYYDGSFDGNTIETIHQPGIITPGSHSVRDLIRAMIVSSDNNATQLLQDNIGNQTLAETYTDLGLSVPVREDAIAASISAKQYSYFFRVLYNATYLSPEYSEEALEILSASSLHGGIAAGIPGGVSIAEKFGERTVETPHGAVVERQLHDCGIIYAPKHPYFLCIMTRGTGPDFSALSNAIRTISKIVYDNT